MDIFDNDIEFNVFTPGDWAVLNVPYDFTHTLIVFKVVFYNLRT